MEQKYKDGSRRQPPVSLTRKMAKNIMRQTREGREGLAIPYSRTIFQGIPWYSVLIVCGILVAVWLGGREEKRLGLPKDTAIDLALVAVPCGIVGARLYYVAMTWETFAANPISVLYVWEGGIAIYGAILGGTAGVLVYARRKRLPVLRLLDILIPGLLLAQAIGRWGNYFNMEAYGAEIRNPLFQFFPAGVLIPSAGGYTWHMATFFYESLWDLCGFCVLWAIRKGQRENGAIPLWYMLIYGSGRFIIEQLRVDSLYVGGLRASRALSLILCGLGAAVLLWRACKGQRQGYAPAVVGLAALIFRWYCLENPWLYGAAMAVGILSCLGCLRISGRAETALLNRTALWLLPVALLDGIGLALAAAGWPSFAPRLQTLLCSLTLPMYMGGVIHALRAGDGGKEGAICR